MSKKDFNLGDLDDLLNSNINQHDEEGLDDPELLVNELQQVVKKNRHITKYLY
jgi:hypothetical protein